MQFVCYPKCSTCKKAQSWLDENGFSYALRDIKNDNPTYEEIFKWHKLSGLPIKKFFNTSGQLYRSMGLKDKIKEMGEEEAIKLLSSDGMLVKRPILISDGKILVGFKQDEWEKALK